MNKKILITGIAGFVGSHLAELCLSRRADVFGTVLKDESLKNLSDIKDKIKIFECDLSQKEAVMNVIKEIKPDIIFHLAGQSFPSISFQMPQQTLNINISTTLNIFEVVRELKIDPVIQIACSSDEYGLIKEDELPVKETNPLRPMSPYAVSKIAVDMLAFQYCQSYQMKTIITRAFNHTGPRANVQTVAPKFAQQIALIEAGKQEPVIKVGNLGAFRDFSDVRDIVKAYYLAVEKCEYGIPYNIGSGKAYQIKEILDILLSLSSVKVAIEQDPSLIRPEKVAKIVCDFSKFQLATDWKPSIKIEETLKDLLDYYRNETVN
ncbi:MAG: GDP-mannose 4,6-dehydratase [bacterium]|nr:GDP-mannose 4,6-dehydratase [bacterium]